MPIPAPQLGGRARDTGGQGTKFMEHLPRPSLGDTAASPYPYSSHAIWVETPTGLKFLL